MDGTEFKGEIDLIRLEQIQYFKFDEENSDFEDYDDHYDSDETNSFNKLVNKAKSFKYKSYFGEVLEGTDIFHGKGILLHKNGGFYQGWFRHGLKHGKGREIK